MRQLRNILMLLCISSISFAQTGKLPQTIGTKNSRVTAPGEFKADSGLIVPTVPRALGINDRGVRYNNTTGNLEVWDGTAYIPLPRLAVILDSLLQVRAALNKKDSIGTTNGILAHSIGGKDVITLVPDSIKDGKIPASILPNSPVTPGAYTNPILTVDQYGRIVSIANGTGSSNSPPTANAGTDQTITLPTSSVTLSGSGNDTDGTIASYSWTKVSGGSATITSASSATTTVTGLSQGNYVFRLTITDDDGATASDDISVVVNSAGNQTPTASAGTDQTITLPTSSVSLSGSGTDTDGTIASYAWTKVSGGSATITSPSTANTSVTGLSEGVYVFRLTVTDNGGATATDDIQITVNAASNSAPTANAGTDQTITLPTSSVTLSGSGNDTDGTIASYSWTKVSGGSATITSASSATTTVTGLTEGVYIFRLTVTDNGGATGTDDIQVTVEGESGGDPQIAKVNLFASGTGVGQISDGTWNNRGIGSGTNLSLSAFNWTDGSSSGITGVISSITNLNDNGSSWAAGGTANFPQETIRLSPSSSSNPITLTLNNMPSGTYTIRIMSSRSVSGSRQTTFSSGAASSTVEAQNNTTTEAVLTGLTPSSGTITITITSTVSSGTSVYLNAFLIEKN